MTGRSENGPLPIQVEVYFLAAVLLSATVPFLFHRWGMGGLAFGHLLLFGAMPLLWARATSTRPLSQTLRLRAIGALLAGRALLMGGLGWVASQGLGVVVLGLVVWAGGHPPEPYAPFFATGAPYWLLVLLLAALPAVTEEMAFRGLILSGYRHLGPRAAWVGTALLFAVMHGSLWRLPSLLLLSLLYSYVAWQSGSIWPGVIMHLVNNTLALSAVHWLPQPGPAAAAPEVPPATVAMGAVLFVVATTALVALARGVRGPVEPGGTGQQAPAGPMLERWLVLGLAASWLVLSMYNEVVATIQGSQAISP